MFHIVTPDVERTKQVSLMDRKASSVQENNTSFTRKKRNNRLKFLKNGLPVSAF